MAQIWMLHDVLLSQQYHKAVKPLSHRDPSIIMQSSPQVKPFGTLPGQIKEMMERIGDGTIIYEGE